MCVCVFDFLIGCDRNSVCGKDERESNANSLAQRSVGAIQAWSDLLRSLDGYILDRPETTFRRQGRRRHGETYFVRELVDVIVTNIDPVEGPEVHAVSLVRDDFPKPLASHHLTVEYRWAPNQRQRLVAEQPYGEYVN